MFFNILSKESKKIGLLVFEAPRPLPKLTPLKDTPFYTVSLKDSLGVLKEMAATGTLTIDKNKVIADFFTKHTLIYQGAFEGDSVAVEAFVKDMPLESLDLVFPGFFFKNNFLRVFDPDLDSVWVKRAQKGRFLVEKSVFAKWVKEAQELPECAPRIIEPAPVFKTLRPRLILRETRGVFVDFEVDGANVFDLKEMPEEERDLLEAGYSKRPSERCYYCPSETAHDALELLLGVGWEVCDRAGKRVQLLAPTLSFTLEGDKIFVAESHPGILESAQKSSHLIDGGLLPKDFLKKCAGLCSDLEEDSGKFYIPKFRAASLSGFPNIPFEGFLNEEKRGPVVKGKFQGTLRPYQEEGAGWLRSLYDLGFHGLLADEMGLGKTVQVIALLSSIEKRENQPHLIVMPKSLLFNWKREFQHFLPHVNVWIHSGSERVKTPESLLQKDVILTSYPLLRLDSELFKQMQFHALVLDEAHLIKNASTKVSEAARAQAASLRVSLTGTPLENRVEDLATQFAFLAPGLIKDMSAPLEELRRKIRPFLLRRKKCDVAKDLPELMQQVVFVEMDEAEAQGYQELYERLRGDVMSQLQTEGFAKSRFQIFEAILRLRQYACHPKLCTPREDSAKLDLLMEEVEEALSSGSKVLVFSQFTKMLDLMEKKLQVPFVRLDGSTKNREDVVTRFQDSKTPLVFLISLKAGGVGLNLEQADTVFLYEPWWNDAVEEQAIARAHRIGRTSPVIAKRYITVGTIEEKILQLKEKKRGIAQALLEESETPAALTQEDIEFLFE